MTPTRHTLRLVASGVFALLAVVVALVPGAPAAHAQSEPAVRVEQNVAQTNFGADVREIRFQLLAQSDDPVRSVLLLYQVDDSPVQNTAAPVFQPGAVVQVSYVWRVADVLLPGTEVRYQWQIETAGGKRQVTQAQTVTYSDSRFNWREAQDGLVTVYWHGPDTHIGPSLLEEARRAQSTLRDKYGLELEKPVRVFAYTRQQDYVSALAVGGRQLEASMAVGGGRIFLLAPGGTSGMTPTLEALRRELSYVVFVQKTSNPYAEPPRWLTEGFTLYMGGEEVSPQNYKALGQLASSKKLLPLRTLNGNFPTGDQDRTLAYVESLSVVKFVFETFGPDKVRALFAAIKEGNTVDDALKKGLGVTLDQLEKRWQDALKSGAAARPAGSEPAAGSSGNTYVDRFFGPAIRYWQGVLGSYTRVAAIGAAAFIVVAVVAVIGGTVYSVVRRGREEED